MFLLPMVLARIDFPIALGRLSIKIHQETLTHDKEARMRSSLEQQQLTFEDLKGLEARGYIRDSKLDQRDGFGPHIQQSNIGRFAESYGLVLGDKWYTEFVSGRSADNRGQFQQFLADARLGLFRVLLVDHTSRFGRNQAECIRYKEELQRLGIVVVFVSQGIISGSDRDFLNERINETLDEAYSRNLSRYVRSGFAEKAALGHAVGRPPLGYRNEKALSGWGARLVLNQEWTSSVALMTREIPRCRYCGIEPKKTPWVRGIHSTR